MTTLPDVLSAAAELLDAGGIQNLSMRRLAARLGITPTTLYGLVADKEELLELVLSSAADGTPEDPSAFLRFDNWQEGVVSWAIETYERANSRPGQLDVILHRRMVPSDGPARAALTLISADAQHAGVSLETLGMLLTQVTTVAVGLAATNRLTQPALRRDLLPPTAKAWERAGYDDAAALLKATPASPDKVTLVRDIATALAAAAADTVSHRPAAPGAHETASNS